MRSKSLCESFIENSRTSTKCVFFDEPKLKHEREISCEEKIKAGRLQEAKNKNNRRLCFFIIVESMIFGIVVGALGMQMPRLLLFADFAVCNIIMLYWFATDIGIVNYPASRYLKFSVAAFGLPAIAYYFFRSRRFPNWLKSFGWAFLLGIVSVIFSTGVAAIVALMPFLLSPY